MRWAAPLRRGRPRFADRVFGPRGRASAHSEGRASARYDRPVHVVVNRVRLKEPIDDAVFEAAQREMPARVSEITGIRSFHVARAGDEELLVVIVGDDEDAIDRMRDEVGNEWMRANVVPHAASPPDRVVGEVVAVFER